MRYEVGQIVFLLSRKDTKVFPAQIIEEIISKKMDGENISYIVRLPNKEQTEICLDDLAADVFHDAVTLEKFMIDSAKSSISRVIKNAIEISNRVFENTIQASHSSDDSIDDEESNLAEVDLGGGVKGKLNLNDLPLDLHV